MFEVVQINLVDVGGSPIIDLRVWRGDGCSGASATTKGFGIAIDGFPKLAAAIMRADAFIKADLDDPRPEDDGETEPPSQLLVAFQKNQLEQLRIRVIYLGGKP